MILYSIILIKLKQQAHPCEQSANIDEQRTRRNKKVHKMAIAINLLFFICRAPLLCGQVIYYFSQDHLSSCIVMVYNIVTSFMAYVNCAIKCNPIMCLMFSSNHRHALNWEMLRCSSTVRVTLENWKLCLKQWNLSTALGRYSRPRAQFLPIRTSQPVNNVDL